MVSFVSTAREPAGLAEPAGPTELGEAAAVAPTAAVGSAEPGGFDEYVAARGAALVRFTTLLTGDVHRAEDLVQDALAKAYLRWGRIRRSDNPDVYVRRLLVNASRRWWRRRSSTELPVDRPAERAAPGDLSAESAERDAIRRLIARLPHRQRAVLVLRYFEDLDDAAIAEILGCGAGTVRTHAMRALHRLRDHLTTDSERPAGRGTS